jgi:hypothetical protein
VIDEQRLEHRRGHLFDVCVVTRLRAKESAVEESPVAIAMVSAKSIDQALLNCEHFIDGQELDSVIWQVGGRVLRSPGSSVPPQKSSALIFLDFFWRQGNVAG